MSLEVLDARGRSAGPVVTSVCMLGELAAGESGRAGSSLAPVSDESGVWKPGDGGGRGRTDGRSYWDRSGGYRRRCWLGRQ